MAHALAVPEFAEADVIGKNMRAAVLDKSLSMREIVHDVGQILRKSDPESAVPFWGDSFRGQEWMQEAIIRSLTRGRFMDGAVNPLVTKDVLATVAGSQSVLIRTDIMPHLENLFVDQFPFVEQAGVIDANGLSHTWDVATDFDDANATFFDDLQAVSPGHSDYAQMQTLVAISMAQRGTTFRMLYAQQQGGVFYDGRNAEQVEMDLGMKALAKLQQKATFQGETKTGALTGADERGTTYTYGYDGFRGVLGGVLSNNASYYPGGTTNIAVDQAGLSIEESCNVVGQQISDAGGNLGDYTAWMNYAAYTKIAHEAGNLLRFPNGAAAATYGVAVDQLMMGGVEVPIRMVPGDSVGSYIPQAGVYAGTARGCTDVTFVNMAQAKYAALGPHTPFVLDIPPGVDGTLTHRYIIAWLASLIITAPSKQAKLRLGL